MHPGVFAEPVVQGMSVAPRCPDAATPRLQGDDALDQTAVAFLLRRALLSRKEEVWWQEHGTLMEKLEADLDALMANRPERLSTRQEAQLTAVLRKRNVVSLRRWKRNVGAASSSHSVLGKGGRHEEKEEGVGGLASLHSPMGPIWRFYSVSVGFLRSTGFGSLFCALRGSTADTS